jgi:anionic cell wall polymer biosynthesis LytR-Cps2A-Psr (LCP) family protein
MMRGHWYAIGLQLLALVLALDLTGAGAVEALAPRNAYTAVQAGTVSADDVTPTPMPIPAQARPANLPPGTINIALLGIDTRPTLKLKNTDVILIASINPDAPALTLLAIPRDTEVYLPGRYTTKINQAYALGGPDLFKKTIRYNFGIDIDYYILVNFAAVVNAVDTLGGIDIVATCPLHQVFPKDPFYFGDAYYVSRNYTDTFSGEVWKAGTRVPTMTIDIPKPGIYTLNGLQTLAYVRARYGVPGGDYDRGRREQRAIRGMIAKARQAQIIPRIPALLKQFQKDVETDLTLDVILHLASIAGRFNDAVIRGRFLDSTGDTGAILPDGTVSKNALGNWNVEQMLSVALNQRPNDGVPVEVWNGTDDPSFGIVVADRLSELGLRVVNIKPAGRKYDRTIIVDRTTNQKGSIIPLLQRTLAIKSSNIMAEPDKSGPRYRIIAGADFNPCYYR